MRAPALLALAAAAVLAAGGYLVWIKQQPDSDLAGFATANGRIEVERVDVATKLPGRVADIRVKEGDLVRKGEVIARLDTTELLAQLASAKASARRATEAIGRAKAELAIEQAEHHLSEVEWRRASELERRSVAPVAEVDRRRAQMQVDEAQSAGAEAGIRDAEAAAEAAQANVDQINATLAEMTLYSPVSGRVEYKLVHTGEVVASGSRLVTILDLSDAYMTVFLPTSGAGRARLGAEARIVLDAAPAYVIPAVVSFVAAEAQFTPKSVETANEREKLMYRVKLAIAPDVLTTYQDYVKAGLTGVGYVPVTASPSWPERLRPHLPDISTQTSDNAPN